MCTSVCVGVGVCGWVGVVVITNWIGTFTLVTWPHTHTHTHTHTLTPTHTHTHTHTGEVQNLDREVKKCLIEVFKKTDEEFLQKASSATPSWKDGSTVATVLVLNDTIYSANLGDSKAILCRRSQEGKLSFVALTKDHNPSNVSESGRASELSSCVVNEWRPGS